MFSPLRSVAFCCITLALPAPALADLVLDKDKDPKKRVNETLVLDPTAKPEKDDGTITIRSKNPTAINPGAPPAKAPNPSTRPPRATPPGGPVVTQPILNPGATPPPGPSPVEPRQARSPLPKPVPLPTNPPPRNAGAPIDPTPTVDVEPLEEMPYISFAAPAYSDGYEVSIINSMRGTGRIRVTTDYGPVYCSGFVFGPSVVATSYACVPGILDDPRVGASKIEEVRIVFDHVFPDQRLWTAQGYVLTLDTELSSPETGLAILHIADQDTSFAADRIQRVGQATPDPRAPLYMLSFPRGGSMQMQHCSAVATDPAYLPAKSFEHNCPSDYGDLGAPIFDAATGAVVGLHLSHELSTGRRFAQNMIDLANWIGDQQ